MRSCLKKSAEPLGIEVRVAALTGTAGDAGVDLPEAFFGLHLQYPVRSVTIVWKLINASSRPWLISGWYGV